MPIGKRLREERERLGFNQTDFAAIGGVGRKSQFNYEEDERQPDAVYLSAIHGAGADVQYIVTGIRSDMALTPDERDLLALFRAASLTGKAAAIGALQGAVGGGGPKISVGGSFHGQVVEGGQVIRGELNIGQANRGKKR